MSVFEVFPLDDVTGLDAVSGSLYLPPSRQATRIQPAFHLQCASRRHARQQMTSGCDAISMSPRCVVGSPPTERCHRLHNSGHSYYGHSIQGPFQRCTANLIVYNRSCCDPEVLLIVYNWGWIIWLNNLWCYWGDPMFLWCNNIPPVSNRHPTNHT